MYSKNVVCAVKMWYLQYKCGMCSNKFSMCSTDVVCAVKKFVRAVNNVCAVKILYVH